MPISFLCDREKTSVSTNQPGFLNFIVIPLFKALSEVIPECDFYVKRAEENVILWKEYVETEEDKKVYEKVEDVSS